MARRGREVVSGMARRMGSAREEHGDDLEGFSAGSLKRRLTSFSLLDLDSKFWSKKELNRWIRRHRKIIKYTLGGLLIVMLMGLKSMVTGMAPDSPDDLHDFTAQEWRAAGLDIPKGLVQGEQGGLHRPVVQGAIRRGDGYRAAQIEAIHALRMRSQAASDPARRP